MNTVFLFPGQGCQHTTMIKNLYNNFDIIKNTINYASRILNYDICKIIKNENKLIQTTYLQPIILTLNVAIWRLWNQKNGLKPLAMAGHSLGEYSALVCNDSITFKNAINLIAKRAYLMTHASKKKISMIAILDLNKIKLKKLCSNIKKTHNIDINICNINTKKQTIISLYKKNSLTIKNLFKNYKIKFIELKMNIASHCNIMFNINKTFKKLLKNTTWHTNSIPLIHNLNTNHTQKTIKIINSLNKHLYTQLKWVNTIKYLDFIGTKQIIECGPNKILNKLTHKMSKIKYNSINDYDSFKNTIQKMHI